MSPFTPAGGEYYVLLSTAPLVPAGGEVGRGHVRAAGQPHLNTRLIRERSMYPHAAHKLFHGTNKVTKDLEQRG